MRNSWGPQSPGAGGGEGIPFSWVLPPLSLPVSHSEKPRIMPLWFWQNEEKTIWKYVRAFFITKACPGGEKTLLDLDSTWGKGIS